MPKTELIHRRPKRRPLDEPTRKQITELLKQAQAKAPVSATYQWHPSKPVLTIDSKLISWVVDFTKDHIEVFASVSFFGRFLDTDQNRQRLI